MATAAGSAVQMRAAQMANCGGKQKRSSSRSSGIVVRQRPRWSGMVVRAEYRRGGGGGGGSDFLAGFVLGGVVFGALGYLVAPVVSKSMSEVAERDRAVAPKKAPKYLEEEDGSFEQYRKTERTAELGNEAALSAAEQKTRKTLVEKIAQLNAAIDDISAQLSADEKLEAELEPAS